MGSLNYRLVIGFIISLLWSGHLFAQKFHSINARFGISVREANSVCKDDNGFIWASSKTGIIRITDDDYRHYPLPYESANAITVELFSAPSHLYAFTNNGQLFSYNPILDRFELLVNLSTILNDSYLNTFSILIDSSGVFWMALSSGLYKYESGELKFVEKFFSDRATMTWFDSRQIIIATTEAIWLFDIQSLSKICLHQYDEATSTVPSLFFDKQQNKLWLGTFSRGLYCYDFNLNILKEVLPSSLPRQPMLALSDYTNHSILVGIDGQGIWEVSKQGDKIEKVFKESVDDSNSLRGNGVYDIFREGDSRIWVCTYSGGVSYFDMRSPLVNQITHHPNEARSLVNNDVNNVIEDHWGKMWFATNNGISCWDRTSNRWQSFYGNKVEQAQVFLSLCEDDKGRIWAGTYSSGFYILDGKSGRELAHYSSKVKGSPILSDFIFSIFKDSRGNIWLGGVDGNFSCYLSAEDRFISYPDEPINTFGELANGDIVLGCTYGISLLSRSSGEIRKVLVGVLVRDLLVLDGYIWICTGGDGLLRYNVANGTVEKFTLHSGLPSNFVSSIIQVDNYLWIGTENGICRMDLTDQSIRIFSSVLQLSTISFNNSARFRLQSGHLAWGTNNGTVTFDPHSIDEIPLTGTIFFQDLSVTGRSVREIPAFKLDKPINELKNISLKYTQNTMRLELLPIGVPAGARFSWKLEGFDKEWTPPINNRIITYTNIPNGDYQLKIKLLDNSLSQVISERSLQVRIIPPFWMTGWFWLVVFIVLMAIVLLVASYYVDKIKQRHTEEKVRFFTNTAHEIRNSLTLIKAPVEELSHEKELSDQGKYYLHLAIEQARRLTSVVTQLMDFQKMDIGKEQLALAMTDIVALISHRRSMFESFAKTKGIELLFTSDRSGYISAIDEVKMEKVIDNLISNAIKYSHPNGIVVVDLKCDARKWILRVKDQGIGVSRKAQRKLFKEFHRGANAINAKVVGSGIGLLLVKNYVTLHRGKIQCISQEEVGSTFQVTIPYREVEHGRRVITASTEEFIDLPFTEEIIPNLLDDKQGQVKEMKILIVEDNDDLIYFMQTALGREFKVSTAENGEVAWQYIQKRLPDLVVSDVMMPGMDGFELCRLMKSTYETSHIPIILLTALTEKNDQLQGLGLGADDYLTKPFDVNLLIQRIKTIISNRDTVREKAVKMINGNTTEPIMSNELNDKFMKKMLEVVRANIVNTEFGKEEFARAMNVSSSLLYKKIKSLTDQSPTDFIKTIRLSHAMELLQSRRYSVTEVSELCGFTSVGYFSTVFRKHFGKPPTEF